MSHSISLYIAEHTRLVPETEDFSAAKQNRVSPESSAKTTLGSRQPIRNEYYVTRVVSQSELSTRVVITSPESSRLGRRTLLGSRFESAAIAYLYTWRVLRPPYLISSHSYYWCFNFFPKFSEFLPQGFKTAFQVARRSISWKPFSELDYTGASFVVRHQSPKDYEFDCQQNNNSYPFVIFHLSRKNYCCAKIKSFQFEQLSSCEILSIYTLMEDFMSLVEKYEFE